MRHKSETILLIRNLFPKKEMRWLLIVLFWLAVGTISAVHWWYLFFGNQPYEWWVLWRAKIIVWSMWGALTPFILTIGARFRIESPKIARHSLILFGYSILISATFITLYATAINLNFPDSFASAPRTFLRLVHWIHWNHFAYFYLGFWVVVAIEQMLGYAVRSHKREIASKELERQLSEARLAQLKNRIHPHFLFNTLGAISASMVESDKDRALEMITRLAHLLRLSLTHGEKQMTPLSEEIKFSQEYLELMTIRYPESLTYKFHIPPETEKALIPSLVLQPLIENAVKHGIGKGENRTQVRVAAALSNNRLAISIINDNDNHSISINVKAIDSTVSTGQGLALTHERLQQLYGNDYELVVDQSNPEQTCVKLSIPQNFGENKENSA